MLSINLQDDYTIFVEHRSGKAHTLRALTGAVMTTATQVENDLTEAYSISPEQIELYRVNGYIKLKHVLSPETLAYYGRQIPAR